MIADFVTIESECEDDRDGMDLERNETKIR